MSKERTVAAVEKKHPKPEFKLEAYIEAAESLYKALENLYSSLVESDQDHNQETGEEYHDCAVAREVLDEFRELFE